jgi:hypothetical protein
MNQHLSPVDKVRVTTNLGHLVLSVWAMTIALPMRRFAGKDFIGIRGLMGIFLILLYAAFADAPQLFLLLPIYLLSIVLHLVAGWGRRMRGFTQHTYYEGDPWVARLFLFDKNERRCRGAGEPVLAFAVGVYLLTVSESLGLYFIIGSVAMMLVQHAADRQLQRRIDEIHNGRIENANVMREVYTRHIRRR